MSEGSGRRGGRSEGAGRNRPSGLDVTAMRVQDADQGVCGFFTKF
jgi:hypothetical protein